MRRSVAGGLSPTSSGRSVPMRQHPVHFIFKRCVGLREIALKSIYEAWVCSVRRASVSGLGDSLDDGPRSIL